MLDVFVVINILNNIPHKTNLSLEFFFFLLLYAFKLAIGAAQ